MRPTLGPGSLAGFHLNVGAAVTAAAGTPTGPAFDVVLLLHVTCAAVGLGTVVVSVVQAARVLALVAVPAAAPAPGPARLTSSPDAPSAVPLVVGGLQAPDQHGSPGAGTWLGSYYAPGTNWLARILYGVPILGVALVAMSGGHFGFADHWVLAGIVLWLLVIAAGEAAMWPAERRIGAALRAGVATGTAAGTPGAGALRRDARAVCASGTLMAVVLVVTAVLMVAQP